MPGRSLLVLAPLTLLLAACSAAPAPAPAEPSAGNAATPRPKSASRLDDILDREVAELPKQAVRSPDGAWSATIEGTSARVTAESSAAKVSTSVGTQQDVSCLVYDKPFEIGAALDRIIRGTKQGLDYQRLEASGIVPVGGNAAVFVNALYTADTERRKVLGQLKMGLYSAPGAPIVCIHDEPGYDKTFQRVAVGFLSSFASKAAAAEPQPSYMELHIAKLEGLPIGFYRRTVHQQNNQRSIRSSSLLLLAHSPVELQLKSSESQLELDANLRVRRGTWQKSSGALVNLSVVLQRNVAGAYEYSGMFGGKKLEGSFTVKDKQGLASDLSTAALLREAASSGRAYLQVEEYHPESSPDKPLPVRYEWDPTQPRNVQISMGDGRVSGALDEHGLLEHIESTVGQLEMVSQRVASKGKP